MKTTIITLAFVLGHLQEAAGYETGSKALGTTDPNVTENCKTWANKITSGDTCEKLEDDFGLDFLQLHEWNPSLVKDPCAPISGWSYCVDSPSKSNSLASNVGTDAPVLSNPNHTSSSASASTVPASASVKDTTPSADPSASDSTSTPSSASTSPSPPDETGGAAAVGHGDIGVLGLAGAALALVL